MQIKIMSAMNFFKKERQSSSAIFRFKYYFKQSGKNMIQAVVMLVL